ncbi:HNH endonuclease [Nocardiopsis sp. SBT366]|uniref:HNH endonuclease n=1 Tax=Nocardiopsis sp. SBT366 TaxID=1580529 RepID=UPI00069F5EA9|nr:HNH endonuclease [Nocardiopsis sp. SBT366]
MMQRTSEAFKLALLDAYRGRCAVTGRAIQPTLEAAHIHPVADGGLHRLDNGLLLRADVHKLFDAGYLTITPKLTVQVSPSLHRHSPAADEYTGLEGAAVSVPQRKADRPHQDALAWHTREVFKSD